MRLDQTFLFVVIYISRSWQQKTEFLLAVFEKTIERIDPVTGQSDVIQIENGAGGQITNIEFDIKYSCLFFSTSNSGQIKQLCFDGRQEERVIVEVVGSVTGLSYDWTTELLYFANTEFTQKIEVVKIVRADGDSNRVPMKNYMRRTIIGNLTNQIFDRDVLADPVNGYLFWTNIGFEAPSIWRSHLDGSDARMIVSSSYVAIPIRLSIDYNTNRIYWSDHGVHGLGGCNLNGNAIRMYHLMRDPDCVVVRKDRLYWSSSKTQSIYFGTQGDFDSRFNTNT